MRIKICGAALLAAALLAGALALAQETAPLAVRTQQEQTQEGERIRSFGRSRSYRGVAASESWLFQARLGNRLLNMRMYTAAGEQITFQENLTAADTGEGDICLQLLASERGAALLLQLDQDAVDTLTRLGITEIVVADIDRYVRASYLTSDLRALRSMFSVGRDELLCVSGAAQPVTVVSVDGVRRQITQ